jgi:hypothetical protein
MTPKLARDSRPIPVQQRGAALFVAMMILILMSLLAVSASQVTMLQERMVQAYWSDVQAFEATEERLRQQERRIKADALISECPIIEPQVMPAWMRESNFPAAAGQFTANVGKDEFFARRSGLSGSASISEETAIDCAYFIIAATDNDVRNDAQAKSWAVVQSVYVP